jgi:NADPH2:quinone reductase
MIRGLYQFRPEPPFVPGSECAGVITEVGDEVSGLAIGDRILTICGSGAFATEVVATPPSHQLHRIPDEMPFDEASSFNMTYGTAIHGLLRRGGLRAGESVLVLGASGGCGSAAVQIAKAAGATVIAVAGGAEKCELARQLGADAVLDHQNIGSLSQAVKELTDGRGVDVVFDTVGGADVREPLRSLAWNGRYLVIGFASGDIPTLKANQAILKCISIVGVAYGMSAILDPQANVEDFAQLFDWYRQGKVAPAIGHRFPLADTAEALRVVHERRALGKVVIEMPA